ncbi:hypothetical protein G7Z17_g3197 [Cylindrodendrum hubeiense]|uniref:Heterokaryon incompatibility domain-containing protein n=1 Tax=Cylindrodendrum hubeiense TaxID=595255 RepID=A0A9P5HLR8_9HYPO|nr:hypothetical protein G7Z17_g3197 [Cylindrodendrum hubeiense]
MADYYQYAWLTICATMATDGGGISREIVPAAMPRVARLPYRSPDGEDKGYFYVQCVGAATLAKDYKEHIAQSSLLQRGWVYQEWMLSRRVLAFSAMGVFVQCQEGPPQSILGDDVFDRGEQEEIREEKLPAMVDIAFKESIRLDFSTRAEIFRSWERVVEAYSGLGLTKIVSDRLVALAGVAKEFDLAIKMQDERDGLQTTTLSHRYTSGLWYGDVRGLLWEQVTSGPRVRVDGIPTWSWASMATRVLDEKGTEVLSGMAVRCPETDSFTKTKYRVKKMDSDIKCKAESAFTIRLDQAMKPRFDQGSVLPTLDEYDNDSRFVMLRLQGKLTRVIVDIEIVGEEDDHAMWVLTAHAPNFGRSMWRRVSTHIHRHLLRGWASIEHPDCQVNAAGQLRSIDEVYALLVIKIPKAYGGCGFGNLSAYQPCFQVLYLKAVHVEGFSDTYERLGVGRMFGNDVDSCFELAEEKCIWLV